MEGVLEQVENEYDPLDHLVRVTGAVNRDCEDCQSNVSPRASSDGPCPFGRVGLEVMENPGRDKQGEENGVNKLP